MEFIDKLDENDNLVICDMARTVGFVIKANRLEHGMTADEWRERLETLERLTAAHKAGTDA